MPWHNSRGRHLSGRAQGIQCRKRGANARQPQRVIPATAWTVSIHRASRPDAETLPSCEPVDPHGFADFSTAIWLRTKVELTATILLPNSVAAHDRERHPTDGRAKIFKENNTAQDRPSPGDTAVTEFRVRCIRPLCHLSELRRLERRGAVFSGDGGETQGRDAAACDQSSRPSLRSSEYGPPPRSAMAKLISPHISVYS
jgi:hypothetical protein